MVNTKESYPMRYSEYKLRYGVKGHDVSVPTSNSIPTITVSNKSIAKKTIDLCDAADALVDKVTNAISSNGLNYEKIAERLIRYGYSVLFNKGALKADKIESGRYFVVSIKNSISKGYYDVVNTKCSSTINMGCSVAAVLQLLHTV